MQSLRWYRETHSTKGFGNKKNKNEKSYVKISFHPNQKKARERKIHEYLDEIDQKEADIFDSPPLKFLSSACYIEPNCLFLTTPAKTKANTTLIQNLSFEWS